jgi:hypothetical protein
MTDFGPARFLSSQSCDAQGAWLVPVRLQITADDLTLPRFRLA